MFVLIALMFLIAKEHRIVDVVVGWLTVVDPELPVFANVPYVMAIAPPAPVETP